MNEKRIDDVISAMFIVGCCIGIIAGCLVGSAVRYVYDQYAMESNLEEDIQKSSLIIRDYAYEAGYEDGKAEMEYGWTFNDTVDLKEAIDEYYYNYEDIINGISF